MGSLFPPLLPGAKPTTCLLEPVTSVSIALSDMIELTLVSSFGPQPFREAVIKCT